MTIYLIIAAYLLLMLLSGIIGMKQSKTTPEDYFLASRGLGAVVLFFTFIATNFSAFFFLGFAGAGYRIGYSYYAMMSFGTAFAALSFYWVGFKVWKLGKQNAYVTPSELIGDLTGSQPLKMLFLAVMVFFTIPYMAIQPIGAGIILETLTNGQIPYFWGASLLTVFIVLYVFLGGMRTVAITDMIQGILMFVLMFWALIVVANSLGGLSSANAAVYQLKPELFGRAGGGDYFTYQKWFSFMCLWMLCVPMFPHMFMRFYISKSAKAFKLSTVLYAVVPLILFICPVTIGVLGHLDFPDLQGKAADQILPLMLDKHAATWLAALIMTGALAAFMSTLDSQLLALSTMLTRDVYVNFWNKTVSFERQVFLGKILVIILALVALFIAYQPPDTIFAIVTQAFTGISVLFPATFAILYFREKVNANACFIGIIAGEGLLLALSQGWIPKSWMLGFDAVVPITLLTSFIIFVGSVRKQVS